MDTRTVYDVEHVKLLDGKEMTVKPFSIKKNRDAKRMLEPVLNPKAQKDEDGEDKLDDEGNPIPVLDEEAAEEILIDVVAMAMEGQEKLAPLLEDRDKLSDALDIMTIYEIVKVATGYDFLAAQKRQQKLMEQMANMEMQAMLRASSN